jgi:periplasmic divalent cation tolerance protein
MYVVILVTASSSQEARKIADKLIRAKLIACANIVEGIKSIFWWEGRVDSAGETLLIMKSRKSFLTKIIKTVKAAHSYETPEIIALPIIAGDKKYLGWIDESLRRSA